MQVFAPQFPVAAREYNLWGCSGLFKRNVERHPEGFGDALQLLYCGILLAATDGVQVLLANPQTGCQFRFADVFFAIAFFKSIFVSLFISFSLIYKVQKSATLRQSGTMNSLQCRNGLVNHPRQ